MCVFLASVNPLISAEAVVLRFDHNPNAPLPDLNNEFICSSSKGYSLGRHTVLSLIHLCFREDVSQTDALRDVLFKMETQMDSKVLLSTTSLQVTE